MSVTIRTFSKTSLELVTGNLYVPCALNLLWVRAGFKALIEDRAALTVLLLL